MVIFLILLNLKKINFKKNINLFYTFMMIVIYKTVNINNCFNIVNIINVKLINMNLTNGVLLIHPFIMYYCYVLFIVFFYFIFIKIKYKNMCIINIKNNNDLFLKTSFLSLLLGSY